MPSPLSLLCVPLVLCAATAHAARLQDTSVFIDPALVAGTSTSVLVRVDEATNLFATTPIGDATVSAQLGDERAVVKTDASGTAVVRLRVPDAVGSYELIIDTTSPAGRDRVTRPVRVIERRVLQLRTDRTQYQPGQSIHWRTTTLNAVDAHPVAAEVVVELRNAGGTLLWRDTRGNDRAGMAAGEIAMSPSTVGRLSLTARVGTVEATEALEVKRVTMPRMHLAFEHLSAPEGPSGRVSGIVVARYPYGEPVRGTVVMGLRERVEGPLDDQGRFAFTIDIGGPGTTRELRATVIDGAGRQDLTTTLSYPAKARFAVSVVPSRRHASPNEPIDLTIITTRGDALAPAALTLTLTNGSVPATSLESPGVVRVRAVADAKGVLSLEVKAMADGVSAKGTTVVTSRNDKAYFELGDAVVASGDAVSLDGKWPDAAGPVVATLLRAGTAVTTTSVVVDAGRLSASLPTPRGVFGLCTVRVAEVRWDARGNTKVVIDERPVFITPARLDLHVAPGVRHAPGDTPTLSLHVTDAAGTPQPGVGIAASVVDERALMASRTRVDLAATLGAFDPLESSTRIADTIDLATIFARWLATPTPEAKLAARAVIEVLERRVARTIDYTVEAPARLKTELDRLKRAECAALNQLDRSDALAFVRVDGAWRVRAELFELLDEAGWQPAERLTPWAEPTTFEYARQLASDLTQIGRQLAERRLAALAAALPKTQRTAFLRAPTGQLAAQVAKGTIAARLALDPWGQTIIAELEQVPHPRNEARQVRTIALRSIGPDGIANTGDDQVVHDALGVTLDWGRGLNGLSYSGSGVGTQRMPAGKMTRAPAFFVAGREDADVRRRFDETVLWAIGITTDHDGNAEVAVPLADSITGWEVQLEAVAPDGAVGVAKTRLETFLPLHVAAETPDTLIVGDRYVVPAIIANHTADKKVLSVVAEGSGIEVAAKATLEVAPGAVVVSEVELVARASGNAKVKLTLREGERVVDVLERSVTIEPVGALDTTTYSQRASADGVHYTIDVPAAIVGTASARIQVYRDLVDLSSDGFEDMIKEPNGCFEQTSSTTHPNVLLLDLFGTNPRFANARAKARDFVGKGYQRLVSYEVPGTPGGFSLFGRAPASRTLTAYGLVEFTDMARVYPVDPALLARTRKWLESEQRPDGSWPPDNFSDTATTTAFIAWALAESGGSEAAIDHALDYLERTPVKNAYTLALWANAEAYRRRTPVAGPRFAKLQTIEPEGNGFRVPPGATAWMGATGFAADVQLTALGAMRAVRIGAPLAARSALDWLWAARAGRGWTSTHGIMLALRAAQMVTLPQAPLSKHLPVTIDGAPVGTIALQPERGVPALEVSLTPGVHTVSFAAPEGLRSDLRLTWRATDLAVSQSNGIEVTVRDAGPTALGDELVQHVTLTNHGREPVHMPTVVVPVPPGFQANPQVQGESVASAEDLGSALNIYLTELAPGASVELRYTLRTSAECTVMQRPIRAYAYYDPSTRGSSAPQRLTVQRTTRRAAP